MPSFGSAFGTSRASLSGSSAGVTTRLCPKRSLMRSRVRSWRSQRGSGFDSGLKSKIIWLPSWWWELHNIKIIIRHSCLVCELRHFKTSHTYLTQFTLNPTKLCSIGRILSSACGTRSNGVGLGEAGNGWNSCRSHTNQNSLIYIFYISFPYLSFWSPWGTLRRLQLFSVTVRRWAGSGPSWRQRASSSSRPSSTSGQRERTLVASQPSSQSFAWQTTTRMSISHGFSR